MASSSNVEEQMEQENGDVQLRNEPKQKQSKNKSVVRNSQLLYRLKKLRKKMEIYSRQIKKFNEESLGYSDMERSDSAYMKVDALQRKLLKTWEEFCRVQGMSPNIAVKYNTTGFTGTHYEELNKKIDRLLDKSVDSFPDYIDVLTIVQRCTTKHKLPISSEEQSIMSRRLFQDIIKELKRRRQSDFVTHFGSHLTDECKRTSDPALENAELHTTLERQHVEGEEKMAKVIEGFVVQQEINPQGSEQAEEDEDYDDNDDEDKESEKDKESGRDDIESEGKNDCESDHSNVAETVENDSFEMTLELGKDEAAVEDGKGMVVTSDSDNNQCDLPLDASPSSRNTSLSPLLPSISEQETAIEETTSGNISASPAEHNGQTTLGTKQEYSYDIIVIDD